MSSSNYKEGNHSQENRFSSLMDRSKKLLKGNWTNTVMAGFMALPIAAPVESNRSYSPNDLAPEAIVGQPWQVEASEIPSEITLSEGTILQQNPFYKDADTDIKLDKEQTLKVKEEKFGKYTVSFNGKTYWIDKPLEMPVKNEPVTQAVEENTNAVEEETVSTYVVIEADVANVRSAPSTASSENIVTTVKKGDEYDTTGEVISDQNGITWREIFVPDPKNPEEMIKGWIHVSVIGEINTRPTGPTSEGIGGGGVVEPTTSEEITSTEEISTTEVISQEISSARETMDQILPENFRQYYEQRGGTISWNDTLQLYEVSFKSESGSEKKFIFLPQSGSQLTAESDLSEGLYYLGEEASLTVNKVVDGKPVTQSFHFVISPNFPKFEGHDFWKSISSSIDEETEITITTATEDQKQQIAESLVKLFGFKESEQFNLFIAFSGQDMELVDTTNDKSRQVRGVMEDGNDHQLTSLDLTNENSEVQTYASVFYAQKDALAEHYLLNPEFSDYFGSGRFWSAFERISSESAWREKGKSEELLDFEVWDEFYLSTFAQHIFDIEAQLTQANNGKYKPVFDIKIPPEILKAYTASLSTN